MPTTHRTKAARHAAAALALALGAFFFASGAQAQEGPSYPMGIAAVIALNPDLASAAMQMFSDWPKDQPDSRAAWRTPLDEPSGAQSPKKARRGAALAAAQKTAGDAKTEKKEKKRQNQPAAPLAPSIESE